MKRKENQMVPIYDNYERHVAAHKTVKSPFIVSKSKGNHLKSDCAEEIVDADYPFGNTSVYCEIRQGMLYNYSISYKTDVIDSRILARLDTGDGVHNNRVPGIPLELTSVPTPHIHLFRKDGYSVAYPINGIDYSTEASTKFDYQQGFDYFCECLNITDSENKTPQFQHTLKNGQLVFPILNVDPNEDADFDQIY